MDNAVSLYCLTYAESTLPERMVFDGGRDDVAVPISFAVYLIKTDGRNILVDAGCDTMPGFEMKRFYSPAFVLRRADVCADEITDVVITHAHHDHIEAVTRFKNAVVHISRAEYERAGRYLTPDLNVNLFEKRYAIAPCVTVIEWGGHSEGSSIVEIETENGRHVIAGDECYTNENIASGICTGAFFCKERATAFVKTYGDRRCRVHTCHDSSLKTERIV